MADVLRNTLENAWRWIGMDESRRWERTGLWKEQRRRERMEQNGKERLERRGHPEVSRGLFVLALPQGLGDLGSLTRD